MTDLTRKQVAELLALQGYRVPQPDLSDVTWRINALMERIRDLDALTLADVEPWSVQPSLLGGAVGD